MNPFNRFGLLFYLMSVPAFFSLSTASHVESIHRTVIVDLPIITPTLPSNDNNDQIRKIALRHLKKLQQQNQRTLRQQRKQVATASEKLKRAITDAIAKKIIDTRRSIVGYREEYIGEGMSQRIQVLEGNPSDYPYYKIPKTHRDLYEADVQLQQTKARQTAIAYYQKNVDELVSAIRQRKSASVTFLEKKWIQRQIGNLIQEGV